MRRRSRSPREIGPFSSDDRRRIVVFTEGEKTEVSYLEYWAKLNKDTTDVDIKGKHGVPWSLVRWAAATRRQDRHDLRRREDNTEYWCVFDVNSHSKVPDSIEMARANNIKVAVSNPCIELWFILHYEDLWAYIERGDAQSRCKQLLRWHKKALPGEVLEKLVDRYEDARIRARRLDQKHQGDGRPPRSNPSSEIWKLVDRIQSA